MLITVNFNSIDEMLEFSNLITGNMETTEKREEPVPAPVPTAQPVPQSYGQQIAPHFPAANNSQVPAAPVTQAPPVQTAPVQQPAPAPVQTTAPAFKLDDLSSAAMQLMDKGMQAQLQQLLGQFGVEALPQLPADQYGNFATALRGLGAQI